MTSSNIKSVMLAAFVLMLVASCLLLLGISWGRAPQHDIDRSERRIAQITSLCAVLIDLETAQRGFVITGKEDFLEPYWRGLLRLRELRPALQAEMQTAAADRALMRDLNPWIDLKLEELAQTVSLRRARGFAAVSPMVAGEAGKIDMDHIRAGIGALIDAENRHLGALRVELKRRLDFTDRAAFFVMLIRVIVLSFLLFYFFRVMNARQRADHLLKESEETFRVAMENAPIGNALVDTAGRFLKVNHSICAMLGLTEPDLLARDLHSITHPEDTTSDATLVSQVLAGDLRTYQMEKRYRHSEGHFIWAMLSVSLVRNVDGSPRYFVAQFQDVTERKELDRAKREFIATVSHELRTPLTSIRGSLGLVADGVAGELPDKAARLIKIAYHNTGRLTLIINDILDAEKIDSGKMTLELASHPLGELVEQAVDANQGYAENYRVRFVLQRPLPQVLVRADASRILQVLANLMSNAVKFSPAAAEVQISVVVLGTNVRVSVTDHGPGIPASFEDRIFDKFSQADSSDSRPKGGTGLGLTISKALIEQMGGTIGYTSVADVATAFYFEMPVDRTARSTPVACGFSRVAGVRSEEVAGLTGS